MALTTDFDGDVAYAVADMGASLTWKGTAYACVVGTISKQTSLELAGLMPNIDIQVVVQTSLFSGARPAIGQTVVIGSVTYRIDRVETDEAGAALNLYLVHQTE